MLCFKELLSKIRFLFIIQSVLSMSPFITSSNSVVFQFFQNDFRSTMDPPVVVADLPKEVRAAQQAAALNHGEGMLLRQRISLFLAIVGGRLRTNNMKTALKFLFYSCFCYSYCSISFASSGRHPCGRWARLGGRWSQSLHLEL